MSESAIQASNQATNQSTKGFGSFQSTSIEYLVHQSDADYRPPHTPINISTLDRQPISRSTNQSSDHSQKQSTDQSLDQLGIHVPAEISDWPVGHYQSLWSLDSSFTFINHGAFGASMQTLQSIQIDWLKHLEKQPLRMIDRELLPLIGHIDRLIGQYLHCSPTNVVMADNVTTVMSAIMRTFEQHHYRSLTHSINQPAIQLTFQYTGPQRTILYTNVAYGAVKKLINQLGERTNTRLCEVIIDFPCSSQSIYQSVNESINRCRKQGAPVSVAFFDHITSNTAIKVPINRLVDLCKEQSIITVVDGAHAPFNVHPLRLGSQSTNQSIDADFYTGNFHKWMSNPKGAAFLFVSDRILNQSINQSKIPLRIEPPTISHGFGSGFHSEWAWTGTHSYSAQLTVLSCLNMWLNEGTMHQLTDRVKNASINQSDQSTDQSTDQGNQSIVHSIDQVRSYCISLCKWARIMLIHQWNSSIDQLTTDEQPNDLCMTCVPLPSFSQISQSITQPTNQSTDQSSIQSIDGDLIQSALYHRYAIECPIKTINILSGQVSKRCFYARISCHAYNQPSDYIKLANAVMELVNDPSLLDVSSLLSYKKSRL